MTSFSITINYIDNLNIFHNNFFSTEYILNCFLITYTYVCLYVDEIKGKQWLKMAKA